MTWPPMRWRQEWQEKVYRPIKTAFSTNSKVPRFRWNPSAKKNARIASTDRMTTKIAADEAAKSLALDNYAGSPVLLKEVKKK